MGWEKEVGEQGRKLIQQLVHIFQVTDADLLEINPLVLTKEGNLTALDAKLTIDDNALFRQPGLKSYDDPSQVTPQEARAKEYDLAYVALDGNIGCMVNGAGLAMATMDIIQHYGGTPANFLDVGGSATKEKVAEGFKIILSDPKVRAILVNIFGGIMNCGTFAAGVDRSGSKNLPSKCLLSSGWKGQMSNKGEQLLHDSGLQSDYRRRRLDEAAEKAVRAAKVR